MAAAMPAATRTTIWASASTPDAEDLAHQQVARPDRGQDHLDDPALLLLDDAGEDPGAVREDADEHEDDPGVREDDRGHVLLGRRVRAP